MRRIPLWLYVCEAGSVKTWHKPLSVQPIWTLTTFGAALLCGRCSCSARHCLLHAQRVALQCLAGTEIGCNEPGLCVCHRKWLRMCMLLSIVQPGSKTGVVKLFTYRFSVSERNPKPKSNLFHSKSEAIEYPAEAKRQAFWPVTFSLL